MRRRAFLALPAAAAAGALVPAPVTTIVVSPTRTITLSAGRPDERKTIHVRTSLPTINGHRYSWASVTVVIAGRAVPLRDVKSIRF